MEKDIHIKQKYIGDPATIAKKIHVPTYDEILQRIKSRYPKKAKRLFDKELARLQATYDISLSKTDFIRELTRLLDSLHPFYWKLIEIDFDRRAIHDAIKCISRARRLSRKFFDKYKIHLLAAENKKELLKAGSEARGRILSLYKKCRKHFDYLRNLVIFIQHLPSIEPDKPTVIVAGAPSTGKSTFVKNVSRAQPKVASYPFTTTQIHIGHIIVESNGGNEAKIQVIDTPGLLDRPLTEMNPVEQRAVAALKEIPGIILFLIDVSPHTYMDVKRQFNLLESIKSLVSGKTIVLGINKIDIADEENLKQAIALADEKLKQGSIKKIYKFSAEDSEQSIKIIYDLYKTGILTL